MDTIDFKEQLEMHIIFMVYYVQIHDMSHYLAFKCLYTSYGCHLSLMRFI